MNLEKLMQTIPELSSVLQTHPQWEPRLKQLLERKLGGVFQKYLKNASQETWLGFLKELGGLDFERIELHRKSLGQKAPGEVLQSDVEPVSLYTLEEQASHQQEFYEKGKRSLQEGKWAAVAFAGGAGTRFFSRLDALETVLDGQTVQTVKERFGKEDPKGAFPITPVGGMSFFDLFVAETLQAGIASGTMPWLLFMTSPNTHKRTQELLLPERLMGLPKECLVLFEQAFEPRLDEDGDLIVVDDGGQLAKTGDGHGGVYRALAKPSFREGLSLLDELKHQGIQSLIMHNVDNAAAHPFEPQRLGFHLQQGSLFTLSATRKTDPAEAVGLIVLLRASQKVEVVEYNVLDPAIAQLRLEASGRLLHEAANTNTHLISIEAIQPDLEPTLYQGKRIVSRKGSVLASSLEMLSQHLTRTLPAEKVRAFEIPRPALFMPTKNITGNDSAESTMRDLAQVAQEKLKAACAQVAPTAICDLHPCLGLERNLEPFGLGSKLVLEAQSRFFLGVRRGVLENSPIAEGRLTLDPNSSLIIRSTRPYGDVLLGTGRSFRLDEKSANGVTIGPNVTLKAKVKVEIELAPGARVTIPAGKAFQKDLRLDVPAYQHVML